MPVVHSHDPIGCGGGTFHCTVSAMAIIVRGCVEPPRIARDQGDVFTSAQAMSHGYTARQVRARLASQRWHAIAGRGLTALPPAGGDHPWPALTLAWAAHVTWPDAIVGYHVAGALHGFPLTPVDRVHVLLPVRRAPLPGLTPHHVPFRPADIALLPGGLPVTSPTRTAVDCLAALNPDQAWSLLAWLVTRQRLDRALFTDHLIRRFGRPGTRQLRTLHAQSASGAVSPPERRLHHLLRRGGLDGWCAGARVFDRDGLVGVVDVLFEKAKVVLEVDGLPRARTCAPAPRGTGQGRSPRPRSVALPGTTLYTDLLVDADTTDNHLAQIEFVHHPRRDLARRMLHYRGRILHQDRETSQLTQHLIVLAAGSVADDAILPGQTTSPLNVIYLRDQDAAGLLTHPVLAPLATLAATPDRRECTFREALKVITTVKDAATRAVLTQVAATLAGIHLHLDTIKAATQEAAMPFTLDEDTAAGRIIAARAEARGEARGEALGRIKTLEALLRRRYGDDERIPAIADRLAALPQDQAVDTALGSTTLDDLTPRP